MGSLTPTIPGAPSAPTFWSNRNMGSVWIGYTKGEAEAFAVCRQSIVRRRGYGAIQALYIDDLRDAGLYWRPTSHRNGQLWDDISGAAMSTEFGISRFLTPILSHTKWALFVDGDVFFRESVAKLFEIADERFAVMVVKHPNYIVNEDETKKDGKIQNNYNRKNWSSVCLFNTTHPANKRLTVEAVNSLAGRELHAFCWLKDDEIGELDNEWNWLCGVSSPSIDAKIVHYTDGGPWLRGRENLPYADEWRMERRRWLSENGGMFYSYSKEKPYMKWDYIC